MFVQFGLNNAFGVFQAYYETHQLADHTSDAVGWLGGVQQFLFLAGGLVTGPGASSSPRACSSPRSAQSTTTSCSGSRCSSVLAPPSSSRP
jgi:hypothetical protein